jgi:hypothetical protein
MRGDDKVTPAGNTGVMDEGARRRGSSNLA